MLHKILHKAAATIRSRPCSSQRMLHFFVTAASAFECIPSRRIGGAPEDA